MERHSWLASMWMTVVVAFTIINIFADGVYAQADQSGDDIDIGSDVDWETIAYITGGCSAVMLVSVIVMTVYLKRVLDHQSKVRAELMRLRAQPEQNINRSLQASRYGDDSVGMPTHGGVVQQRVAWNEHVDQFNNFASESEVEDPSIFEMGRNDSSASASSNFVPGTVTSGPGKRTGLGKGISNLDGLLDTLPGNDAGLVAKGVTSAELKRRRSARRRSTNMVNLDTDLQPAYGWDGGAEYEDEEETHGLSNSLGHFSSQSSFEFQDAETESEGSGFVDFSDRTRASVTSSKRNSLTRMEVAASTETLAENPTLLVRTPIINVDHDDEDEGQLPVGPDYLQDDGIDYLQQDDAMENDYSDTMQFQESDSSEVRLNRGRSLHSADV